MGIRNKLICFKTYDVRGKLGAELNEEIVYRIGRATVQSLKAKTVALGFDSRETSPSLAKAVASSICDAGADTLDIGLSGTEEMYSAVSTFDADAGIEITASHNPIDYNGMKIVKKGSQPLDVKDFSNIQSLAESKNFVQPEHHGSIIDIKNTARAAYIDKILGFVDIQSLKPIKIVLNSGNGAAGPTIDKLNMKLKELGVTTNFVYVHHEPDSSFPNGIPNPMLEQNRSSTASAVLREEADLGVAFDGDFDRCFLFDNLGNFIPGEYVVGLLAEIFLRKEQGASIVHDPRVLWNTSDVVTNYRGNSVITQTGHSFVKAAMRNSRALYGGEMSAHHYFRDFAYCDSGMIPWLMVWQLLSEKNLSICELIFARKKCFPSSGELNFIVSDPVKCLQRVKKLFINDATKVDELDGLSMSFETWRFNLRKSNTEPLLRLNVETRGDKLLLLEKTKAVKGIIEESTT